MCGRVCRQGRAGGAVILLSQPQAIFCVGYSRWYFAFLCSAVGSEPPGVWARYAAGTGGGRWDTGSGITGLLQPPLPPANAWTRLPPLKKKKKIFKNPGYFSWPCSCRAFRGANPDAFLHNWRKEKLLGTWGSRDPRGGADEGHAKPLVGG